MSGNQRQRATDEPDVRVVPDEGEEPTGNAPGAGDREDERGTDREPEAGERSTAGDGQPKGDRAQPVNFPKRFNFSRAEQDFINETVARAYDRGWKRSTRSLVERLGVEDADELYVLVDEAKQRRSKAGEQAQSLQQQLEQEREKRTAAEHSRDTLRREAEKAIRLATVRTVAGTLRFRDPDDATRYLGNPETYAVNLETGAVEGIADALAQLAKDRPYLLQPEEVPATPSTPTPTEQAPPPVETQPPAEQPPAPAVDAALAAGHQAAQQPPPAQPAAAPAPPPAQVAVAPVPPPTGGVTAVPSPAAPQVQVPPTPPAAPARVDEAERERGRQGLREQIGTWF